MIGLGRQRDETILAFTSSFSETPQPARRQQDGMALYVAWLAESEGTVPFFADLKLLALIFSQKSSDKRRL